MTIPEQEDTRIVSTIEDAPAQMDVPSYSPKPRDRNTIPLSELMAQNAPAPEEPQAHQGLEPFSWKDVFRKINDFLNEIILQFTDPQRAFIVRAASGDGPIEWRSGEPGPNPRRSPSSAQQPEPPAEPQPAAEDQKISLDTGETWRPATVSREARNTFAQASSEQGLPLFRIHPHLAPQPDPYKFPEPTASPDFGIKVA